MFDYWQNTPGLQNITHQVLRQAPAVKDKILPIDFLKRKPFRPIWKPRRTTAFKRGRGGDYFPGRRHLTCLIFLALPLIRMENLCCEAGANQRYHHSSILF